MNRNGCSTNLFAAINNFLRVVALLAAVPSVGHAQSAPDFKVYVALPATNYKQFVIPGARGKGGKNYTGTYSGSKEIE